MRAPLSSAILRPRLPSSGSQHVNNWRGSNYATKGKLCNPLPSVEATNPDEVWKTAIGAKFPYVFRANDQKPHLSQWFQTHEGKSWASLTPHLTQFDSIMVPFEFTHPCPKIGDEGISAFKEFLLAEEQPMQEYTEYLISTPLFDTVSDKPVFHRFHAPLLLFIKALEFNFKRAEGEPRVTNLYIAQCQIDDLPPQLQKDLPRPEILKRIGRNDDYGSSIWLGLEETYTPFHQDPNPNFFRQLVGSKTVRITAPNTGMKIFAECRKRARRSISGSTGIRLRGAEMMVGPEREASHAMMWGRRVSGIYETTLDPGDTLFIPNGWWHTLRSICSDGRLNASVNWWFR